MAKYDPTKRRPNSYVNGKPVYDDEPGQPETQTEPASEVQTEAELDAELGIVEAPAPKEALPSIWAQDSRKPRGKEFELPDVLQIVTGKMLGTEGFDSVFDVLSYMTGIRVDNITYPECLPVCRAEIIRQYPKLSRCEAGGDRYEFDPEDTDVWLMYRKREYGDTLHIDKLNDIDASELHETVEMKLRAMSPKKRKPKIGALG